MRTVSNNKKDEFPKRLVIVSHVLHYKFKGAFYAYGPYAREIDIWADLFSQVFIAAPCKSEYPPGDVIPFTRGNINFIPQPETGGANFKDKIKQIFVLPVLIYSLSKAMRLGDAIHVRCPGNLGLLGAIIAPLFSKYRIAKYAGMWPDYPGEPFSWSLQKAILRSRWWGKPVTVYGEWPNEPSHIIPFFTSIMSNDQMERAVASASRKKINNPIRVLYVGRLSSAKNVSTLLSALHILNFKGIPIQCDIVGDGPEKDKLLDQAKDLGLQKQVKFFGGIEFEHVLGFYERADVLTLVSETEGWPKAIVEGMAFGLICIGSNRGLVKMILGDGRGIVVQPADIDSLANVLEEIALAPKNFEQIRTSAATWAQAYSLEDLRDSLRKLINSRWDVQLSTKGYHMR